MKATGIVRKIDELGRLVIPMELRRSYDIDAGDAIEIFTDGESIILRKYEPHVSCVFCGQSHKLLKFKSKNICEKCLSEIK